MWEGKTLDFPVLLLNSSPSLPEKRTSRIFLSAWALKVSYGNATFYKSNAIDISAKAAKLKPSGSDNSTFEIQ
jgi:hypothetical protein